MKDGQTVPVDDTSSEDTVTSSVLATIRQYWGHEKLRPLQQEAIKAGIAKHDSLVVMPTGGGKSLCYQVPPLLADRLDIVVSPLISLMKDQVDGLAACGYPAAAIHSHLDQEERRAIWKGMRQNAYRLVFVAPERLFTDTFLDFLEELEVTTFAIDEAHCISHWGHDFRPEYRKLAALKDRFDHASIHAYTATATPRVRDDIVRQLGLSDPKVHVGTFDRPNLTYRVVPRVDLQNQVHAAVNRHRDEAAIVYCISRKETEHMADWLKAQSIKADAYHAGLTGTQRQKVQEAFATERLDVVCATVAFGMGIDRSNVRLVAHAGMPKSVEHYQQETGRAGRDGLEAECILFYSPADVMKWESILINPRDQEPPPPEMAATYVELLGHMRQYASTLHCRHAFLSEYFGQQLEQQECDACDVCLDEVEGAVDATELAQKILSCVYRVGNDRFGVGHIIDVLTGSQKENVINRNHDQLSTHGLLKGMDRKYVQNATYQLIDQGVLGRSGGEYPKLSLNDASWAVLRGERSVQLFNPPTSKPARSRRELDSWEGADRGLFEHLRQIRREWAEDRGVPPYVIFSDRTLRDLARIRPKQVQELGHVYGIGEKKLADFGMAIVECVRSYCLENSLATSQGKPEVQPDDPTDAPLRKPAKSARRSARRNEAIDLFARGASIDEVMEHIQRTRATVVGYLAEYVAEHNPSSIERWVSSDAITAITAAAKNVGLDRLRPIYDNLGGEATYDDIRLVVEKLRHETHE
ncbi:MAG: DNA helicase RecQ [Planctomycetota bacterium]|jgi:ATP-dependent DNA helicase RecQ